MKSVLIITALVSSVSISTAGIINDSSGNRITVDNGCLYYGDIAASSCGVKQSVIPIVKKAPVQKKIKPVAKAKPAPAPKPVYVAPIVVTPVVVAPVYVAPVVVAAPVVVEDVEPVVKRIIKLEGVSFKVSSSILKSSSYAKLNAAAKELKASPDTKVLVAGHSDSLGNNNFNQALSEKRAASVKTYLVSRGVNADNLSYRGYGEDFPIASNKTRAGRTANRRVELRVIE